MEDVKYIERRVKEVFSNLIFNFEYKKCGCEIEIRNPITFKRIFLNLNYIDVMNDFEYCFDKLRYYIKKVQG